MRQMGTTDTTDGWDGGPEGVTPGEPAESLADRVAVTMLTRAFPAELVDAVLAATGRTQMRVRLLPSRVVVYFVLALCLFPGLKYERVARLLSQGLTWSLSRPSSCPVPTAAALSRARARLGAEPLEALFHATAPRLAGAPGYRGLRVLSLDTARFETADSAENVAAFRPEGLAGPPYLRVVALADERTRAVVAARVGPEAAGLAGPARRLLGGLDAGVLLLADLGTVGVRSWCVAREHGAELLWAAREDAELVPHASLPDGSYRSVLDGAGDCTSEEDGTALAVPVRVVEATVAGRPVRLVTSLLDPRRAPAAELVALHARRWRFAEALAELSAQAGTRQGAACPVLRSRSADGARQEAWGHLLVHQSVAVLLRAPLTADPESLLRPVVRAAPAGEGAVRRTG